MATKKRAIPRTEESLKNAMRSFKLFHAKSTKNTEVYSTLREDVPITSLYLKKSGLPKPAPKTISLSIEY